MSGGLSGGSDSSPDADDLLQIRERFMELRKEKEMLRDSKSQGFELITRLELHVKSLSESRKEDKKRITDLERELSNCIQEIAGLENENVIGSLVEQQMIWCIEEVLSTADIRPILFYCDFLQDQLSMRNSSLNGPDKQVCSCHSKLADIESLAAEVGSLREQIKVSESERSMLLQEIEDKEVVIRYSASCIESLEESISSMALEYQCEIESMKLDLITLEQNLFETKKLLEEKSQENSRMNGLIRDLELRNQDAYKAIESLEKENIDLKEKLHSSDMSTKAFVRDVEEQFQEWLGKTDGKSLSKQEEDMSTYGSVLGQLFWKFATSRASDVGLTNNMAEMSRQMDDDKLLISRLKEDLREERRKSKEEAEDLAQEMAELRYQLTVMLDEECKRRANIEHLSLQRIAELEAQIAKEREKSNSAQVLVVRKNR